MAKQRISRIFQNRLLVCVCAGFMATIAMLWIMQTKMARENAVAMLRLNIVDVERDIIDASGQNMLDLTHKIARRLDSQPEFTESFLKELAGQYDVAEINVINRKGIIYRTTDKKFIGYSMDYGRQSAEFLVLLDGKTKDYVQQYQPISYDRKVYRKYAGTVLERGGFVEVGYDAEHFQKDIQSRLKYAVSNRRIGASGSLIISDKNWDIVSELRSESRPSLVGQNLYASGLYIDTSKMPADKPFENTVYGEECYVLYHVSEGYYIIAIIPKSEVVLNRNFSVFIIGLMEFLVFSVLFYMIYFLMKNLVVDNIHRINLSLGKISKGNLEETVNVRGNIEFEALSDDINSTVRTLKKYIADASARIDAELAFAKSIQHSALPSVFPPYPNRKDFDIYAGMYTAKEVGGDFYDFYFIGENSIAFLIADVSGKGIPAAMFMMTAKTLIKSYAESGMPIEEVFDNANATLCENNETGMFVTAWAGFMNLDTGEISYISAGHNPPIVIRKNGHAEYLKTRPNFVLAGMEGTKYHSHTMTLNPGDKIFLYTDGVTEAVNEQNVLFGEERLCSAVNSAIDMDVRGLCTSVRDEISSFSGNASQADDITMLAFAYHGTRSV